MTNKEFAESNEIFKNACRTAGLEPTKRQASKWLLHKGKVWKSFHGSYK